MKTLKFKTNINCNNCIATITPVFNSLEKIKEWDVDITNPSKILTISGEELTSEFVKDTLKQAGFKAEELD